MQRPLFHRCFQQQQLLLLLLLKDLKLTIPKSAA
jgi:hypothetical protein